MSKLTPEEITVRQEQYQRKRQEKKELRLKYREMARFNYECAGRVDTMHIHIAEEANVQMTEGGAFVEATIWIPREDIK